MDLTFENLPLGVNDQLRKTPRLRRVIADVVAIGLSKGMDSPQRRAEQLEIAAAHLNDIAADIRESLTES